MVQAAAKRFGLPEDRFYLNIEEYANTSAASMPIALNEIAEKALVEEETRSCSWVSARG
ncbi:MAG: hypothetical protein M0C28_22675 [Candidatus Moduliflexus flocculans]|nr:hypothetical protein [Candidatus Moduliflexus flocculans]